LTELHPQDVVDDGQLDLVSHYRTQETGIELGDTEPRPRNRHIANWAVHLGARFDGYFPAFGS
jgi:hypothetical protein